MYSRRHGLFLQCENLHVLSVVKSFCDSTSHRNHQICRSFACGMSMFHVLVRATFMPAAEHHVWNTYLTGPKDADEPFVIFRSHAWFTRFMLFFTQFYPFNAIDTSSWLRSKGFVCSSRSPGLSLFLLVSNRILFAIRTMGFVLSDFWPEFNRA